MRRSDAMSHFACRSCRSPAISITSDLQLDPVVQCQRCGMRLGRWSALKRHVRTALDDEASAGRGRIQSSDPLPRAGLSGT
jgi:DNA-directed RNA polymerase subunit RPC12/RpoP